MRITMIILIGLVFTIGISAQSRKDAKTSKSAKEVQREECSIEITSPKDGETVIHNWKLWTYFTFTIKGTVSNLGKNQLCLYQKKSLDDRVWWRSGNWIKSESLRNGNQFQIDYATCGGSLNRHNECLVKIVVQEKCPNSDATPNDIGNVLCESSSIRAVPKGIFE